jgi:hypothetical protein
MATIYEKEVVFDKLDETFECLKRYIYDAVDHEELHEVEQQIFRKVQEIGRQSLECFVCLSGSGYEEGNPPVSDEGIQMRYKGTVHSPYMSIFGEIKIARAAYQHPMGTYVYPIDATLNLPAHKYSYLLEKWLQASACESDFRSTVDRFNEIFDFSFFPEVPQRLGLSVGGDVERFYEECAPVDADTEGSHIAVSADCKGVRILRSERTDAKEPLQSPRLGKGEKTGIKKDAVVVTDFSFDPEARDPEEVVKGLLNQFTQEEKQQRQTPQGIPKPREALNKHVFASLQGKKEAFDHMIGHLLKRAPEKPLIALLDGDPYLEDMLHKQLSAYGLQERLDALILDIIHVSERLWEVGTTLYGEKGEKRIQWVEQSLYTLLEGKVGYLIGALRQIVTKKKCKKHQVKVIEKTITYFENHRHMMAYHIYLKKGYPIATGLVEGACGSLVKDRMEHSGMRWSIKGAQAVLSQRAVMLNGDWNAFWKYYIETETVRLYPTAYKRVA